MTVVAIWRRLPSRVFFSTALTVLVGMFYASVWILPFLDTYKSGKSFAHQVNKAVPSTQPLYIYADTMNDFNFYTEREAIPVLSSRTEIEKVVSRARQAYILVRDRDLKKLNFGEEGKVLAGDRVGSKKWFLVLVSR